MKSHLKFAAIDIGSNAVRLLLSAVFQGRNSTTFRKMSLIRMPIRLGEDAFSQKCISEEKASQLIQTMMGFMHFINAFRPLRYMACATSAMREAENGYEVCERIIEQTGIEVDIIDGKKEAQILLKNNGTKWFNGNRNYLYVDIGGGSTEITLFSKGLTIASGSFNIGTIRLLKKIVSKAEWTQMKHWLNKHTAPCDSLVAIGSGGNINKTFRLANRKTGKPLDYNKIKEVRLFLKDFSVPQRITKLGLRPDRADVIVPALGIYLKVMKWAGIKKMYVPEVGLADGMVRILYDNFQQSKSKADQKCSNLISFTASA
jgi:exopolyphosphatase/guanosine-5'-triphosphate,3'-diphosphate pyrophosphatase